MTDTLNRAATALVAEHLADGIAATAGKDGTGLLAMTRLSRPILVAALRHYVMCLHADAEALTASADTSKASTAPADTREGV